MDDAFFRNYSETTVHFYDEKVPKLLKTGLSVTNEHVENPQIVDIGSGDGRLIFALCKIGLLNSGSKVIAVDMSEVRIKRLTGFLKFVKGLRSDATEVDLPSSSCDFVICSQLIEHVKEDAKLLQEIKRLLKPKRFAFISSVVKKKHSVYFYFRDGNFRLDPTHIREYDSADEIAEFIKKEGFEVINVETRQIMFPILDLFMRMLIKSKFVNFANFDFRFYVEHKKLSKIRKLSIPVLGYKNIDILVRKN